MNLSAWLDSDRGRLTAMAQHFELTQSAISQWRDKGVPRARMKAVRDFTGGAVSLDDMLPDQNGQHAIAKPCIDVAAPVATTPAPTEAHQLPEETRV